MHRILLLLMHVIVNLTLREPSVTYPGKMNVYNFLKSIARRFRATGECVINNHTEL